MISRDVEEDVMSVRCKGNWSVSRDVEEDVMIKVTGQSAEM